MIIASTKEKKISLYPQMANRHGLITGATGTGKTVTLQVLAEQFSEIGVPVFLQNVKGDLSGIIEPGIDSPKFKERLDLLGMEAVNFSGYPCTFWDVWGEEGHPLRATVSDMGPLMLTKLLNLSEAQTAVLYTVFKYADEQGLILTDFKDLLEIFNFMSMHGKELNDEYRTISSATIGAIQRKLVILEKEGIEHFFGEPALDINDLIVVDANGRGIINVLESTKLATNPGLYSTFLLWLLSELFEELDEVGDLEKPRLVFFFDEAHLIFKDMNRYLMDKFEQVVKLIRSKGIGIFFVTQNPMDIPESILGQLGNRIQHALRAYTPKDQKAVKVAAETFRPNPEFDTSTAITELGVGEALISFLDEKGIPTVVERAYIVPPKSKIGPVSNIEVLHQYIKMSYFGPKYNERIDRITAYEIIKEKYKRNLSNHNVNSEIEDTKEIKVKPKEEEKAKAKTKPARKTDSAFDKLLKSTASSVGSQVGRSLVRGLLGSIKKL